MPSHPRGNDEALRLRHATWFTEMAEDTDALLRTPAVREGREAIEARVDELRAAHRWARSRAPRLAARLTAAARPQLPAPPHLAGDPAKSPQANSAAPADHPRRTATYITRGVLPSKALAGG
jgi:hypothetical protein